jgi:hypothetical protein
VLAFIAVVAAISVVTACTSYGSSSSPASPTPAATTGTGSSSSPSATPAYDAVVHLTVSGGKVTGDTPRAKVKNGQRVAIVVTSDVSDEVHLHGYDKHVTVTAGGTATLVFTANIPGVFVIELESRSKELTKIVVS